MKRRNGDCGKLRRPIKRNKITEGMCGSTTVLYMKFLVLWALVISADFMFMFRFEFLWPFWLLLRSVHDSFKYKGLAFSVLFVCIAITSDLVCLFFIPVHWLLFAASTYVWVQYVWHTDKGICLPTIILWMLFVYLEAGIRWKDNRHMPHLDLCRPFAAHCIGYPVVTLGFGFKSYVGYRMRQRKQREVAKENEFYMQLLQQALPQEEPLLDESAHTQIQSASTTANNNNAAGMLAASTAAITSVSTSAGSSVATQNSSSHNTASSLASAAAAVFSNAVGLASAAGITTTLSSSSSATGISSSVGVGSSASLTANGSVSLNSSQQNHHSLSDHHHHQHTLGGPSTSPTSAADSAVDEKTYSHLAVHTASALLNGCSGNNGGGSGGNIMNGHASGSKSNRRYVEKDRQRQAAAASSENDVKHNNVKMNNSNNNCHQLSNGDSGRERHDKRDAEYEKNVSGSSTLKEKLDEPQSHRNSNTTSKKSAHNASASGGGGSISSINNGNALQYENDGDVSVVAVAAEPVEKTKGRRNRSKKDNSFKDNHHNHNHHNHHQQQHGHNGNNCMQTHKQEHNKQDTIGHNHNNNNNNNLNNNHNNNSDASSVSSSTSTNSNCSTSVTHTATVTLSNLATKVMTRICESCQKWETDVKKYRSEISHMKQIENELRQKLDVNLTNKSSLLAKQRECDELDKRINEMNNARHADMLQMQTVERRLTEERRQKQSLEALLNNEKKARKAAEEKAARPECSAQCKLRKQQMDEEIKQLRRDLKLADDAKLIAEQTGRKRELELRMYEAEIRTRDSNQPDTELMLKALNVMQDKNSTLEKNLSAETRVKLDLFSALGDAKRQLEICDSRRRSKEEEVFDLKAKIAQLLAVMPSDSLCLPSCQPGTSAMLRMSDTPPLQVSVGPGPASPMLSSLNVAQQQAAAGVVAGNATCGRQLNDYASLVVGNSGQSQAQQQCAGVVPVSVATAVLTSGSVHSGNTSGVGGLDPNAAVYTPKGGPTGIIVGNNSDA